MTTACVHAATYRDGSDITPASNEITVTDDGALYLLEVMPNANPAEAAAEFFRHANPDNNGEAHKLVEYGPRRYGIELA